MTDNVDSKGPRPGGRYHANADSTWYYVDDDFVEDIIVGPATVGEPGGD